MSESDVCGRQILTYIDCPRTERTKTFNQMNYKQLTKTFMMIANKKNV